MLYQTASKRGRGKRIELPIAIVTPSALTKLRRFAYKSPVQRVQNARALVATRDSHVQFV